MKIDSAWLEFYRSAPPVTHPKLAMRVHARVAERTKYVRAYGSPAYAMGERRMDDAVRDLAALPVRGSFLDVGCGRGEMLERAERLNFFPVVGVEVVPALIDGRVVYGEAYALPLKPKSVDVAAMFDVIEHLLPGDDELACRELARVARSFVLITANNRRSVSEHGDELHVNRRPYDEWDALFRQWFAPAAVTRLGGPRAPVSEGWRIDLRGAA